MRKPALIDANHYAIHSYFMSKASIKTRHGERVRELKRQLQRIDPDTQAEQFEQALAKIHDPALKNDLMIDGFKATFHSRLIDYVVTNNFDGVIFAREPDTQSWRKEIYAEYKGKRNKADLFDGEEQAERFFETLDQELDMLSTFVPSIWCPQVPYAEGDDIIATFVKWAHKHRPSMNIEISSRDRDYIQLYKYGNAKLYDPQERKIIECSDIELQLQTKILCGDTSDNIKSVRRGYGEVKAMAFYKQGKLDEFLSVGDAREKYNLNRQLIDMDLIPSRITDPILELVDKRATTDQFSIPNTRALHNYYVKNGLFSPTDMKFQRWYEILKSPKFGVFTGN